MQKKFTKALVIALAGALMLSGAPEGGENENIFIPRPAAAPETERCESTGIDRLEIVDGNRVVFRLKIVEIFRQLF